MSPRRNYDPRKGRRRPPGQRSDWTWLVDLLRTQRHWRHHPTPQTADDSRPQNRSTAP